MGQTGDRAAEVTEMGQRGRAEIQGHRAGNGEDAGGRAEAE